MEVYHVMLRGNGEQAIFSRKQTGIISICFYKQGFLDLGIGCMRIV